jgi:type IV secretion system protein VirB10
VIPAVLDSAVNSELPGVLLAHVAIDIYDSPSGRHLRIPQGAWLFGEYASGVAFGQSRLMCAWQQITMPDGRTLDIGEMPGADGVGRSGFTDLVDNHYFRLFSSALLLSGVTAGVAMSQDVGTGNSQRVTAGSAMSQALGQQLGQTTAMLLQKNMNISPTLDIRVGYRFNVIVTKNIPFSEPYRRRPT